MNNISQTQIKDLIIDIENRLDKNGQTYWKFKESREELKAKNSDSASSLTNSPLPETKQPTEGENNSEAISKYQQRMAKTQALNNHASNANSNQG